MKYLSLTEEFVKSIERLILKGEWEIGSKIPPLRELAQKFGLSRSVINAGIVELQNKGYIITYPRKHSEVADWKKYGSFAILNGLIENELYDKEFIFNILQARSLIECETAKNAAIYRTESDILILEKIINEEKSAKTLEEQAALDINFHHTVAVCSHNIIYSMLLKNFEKLILKFVTFFYENNYKKAFVYSRHNTIYRAIVDKNSVLAQETMRELLKQGEEIVTKLFN